MHQGPRSRLRDRGLDLGEAGHDAPGLVGDAQRIGEPPDEQLIDEGGKPGAAPSPAS